MERAVVLPLIVLLFYCSQRPSVAQTPIPAKYDGFAYKGGPVWGDSVLVEAFFDPLCPDSRDAWPPLKQALKHYAPRLSLIVHPFPLPYHSNAYVACRALHIANKLNTSATYPLLELFFKHQEKYYNAPTYHKSRASIIDDMAQLGVMAVGKSLLSEFKARYNDSKTDTAARISFREKYYNAPTYHKSRASIIHDITHLGVVAVGKSLLSEFKAGYNDSTTDTAARISFKYGCSRGVTGTPFFFVNGIPIPDSGSAIDYKKWKSIVDPLLAKREE